MDGNVGQLNFFPSQDLFDVVAGISPFLFAAPILDQTSISLLLWLGPHHPHFLLANLSFVPQTKRSIKVVKEFYMFPGFHKEKQHLTQTHNVFFCLLC